MFKINFSKISVATLKKYTKLIVVFVLVILVVGGYFLWLPKYQEFKTNNSDLNAEGEKIKKKKEYLYELEGHLNNLGEYEENLSKINSAIPFEYSPASLYSFIQKAGADSGLMVSQAEFSKTGSQSSSNKEDISSDLKMNSIDITVSLKGDYLSFKKFISIIFRTSRLIETKNISFESSSEDGAINSFNFQLELSCNYYLEKEDEGGIQTINP